MKSPEPNEPSFMAFQADGKPLLPPNGVMELGLICRDIANGTAGQELLLLRIRNSSLASLAEPVEPEPLRRSTIEPAEPFEDCALEPAEPLEELRPEKYTGSEEQCAMPTQPTNLTRWPPYRG